MKIPNKRERQQIALNHSSDINSKDFIKIYKKCTTEPCSFLVNGDIILYITYGDMILPERLLK